ncbi:hypothetical protein [Alkaliphilus sp. B6464]|uniref:hypothetical protein n=1 Tax=Alkaliphilus sp. B6464 TaxID=2731219 RepID=UPI001BACF1BF|nr:hypothetical protein [Alkaliphilus sp. B6464]QUH21925.1 hypothetical protein HYG84_18495 [Alkaliphilus sp. B6464]
MSRSFKRTPVMKTGAQGSRKFSKRESNKKVRRYNNVITNGKAYRKLYNSWNIYDYIFYVPWSNHENYLYRSKNEWEKYYYRK